MAGGFVRIVGVRIVLASQDVSPMLMSTVMKNYTSAASGAMLPVTTTRRSLWRASTIRIVVGRRYRRTVRASRFNGESHGLARNSTVEDVRYVDLAFLTATQMAPNCRSGRMRV